MKKIIMKVWINKGNNQKLVTIPKNCDIHEGNYVEIKKVWYFPKFICNGNFEGGMKMSKKLKEHCLSILTMILLCIVIALISYSVTSTYDNLKHKGFKLSELSELSEGASHGICTASYDAPFVVCEESERVRRYQLTKDTTQEQLDRFLDGCLDARIIDGTVCIGNNLKIRNLG